MAIPPSRPYTFDRVVRIVAGLLLLVGAIWLVNVLRNVLLPFALACLISYLLEPVVAFNRRIFHLKGRVIASLLTILQATIVLGVLSYFFIPSVISEIHQLDVMLSSDHGADINVAFLPDEVMEPLRRWIGSISIQSLLTEPHLQKLLTSGTSFVGAVLDFLFHTLEWLLTFIYIIFIMIDYPQMMTGFKLLVPQKYRRIVYRVASDINESMNRYFRAQAVLALCAATFYCIGFSIIGIPLAIVLGILVGVLYMIPYFQYITLIPVAIVCLIYSIGDGVGFWTVFGECLLVYAVSQSVCDYILTPKIQGKAMGLNPAIILLSLSVWGTLMGLIGMIIALPLTTLLLAYYQEFVINRGSGKGGGGGTPTAQPGPPVSPHDGIVPSSPKE